jgi:hypothetical protein
MEIFTEKSPYEWKVTALNAQGKEICSSATVTFEKSADIVATPSFKVSNTTIASTDTVGNTSPQASDNNASNDSNSQSSDTNVEMYFATLQTFDNRISDDCAVNFPIFFKASHPIIYAKIIYGINSKSLDNSVDFVSSTGENPPLKYTYYDAYLPPGIMKSKDVLYFQRVAAVQ